MDKKWDLSVFRERLGFTNTDYEPVGFDFQERFSKKPVSRDEWALFNVKLIVETDLVNPSGHAAWLRVPGKDLLHAPSINKGAHIFILVDLDTEGCEEGELGEFRFRGWQWRDYIMRPSGSARETPDGGRMLEVKKLRNMEDLLKRHIPITDGVKWE